jgi:UDP-N-acetylglucosamine 2-epimerase
MKSKPILLCFGTRPEWLKIKPLIKLMKKSQYKLLFTGQHPDLLKDVEVDYQIKINQSDNRLDSIISDCMLQFPNGDFEGVLVQGDTGSAFGCALAAFNRQLKIYYLEAGLRSYNLEHPYPEEGYRQMISRISNVNFAPTELSFDNLIEEKVSGETHIVGNSVLDNLLEYKTGEYGNQVLVTLHRRENHEIILDWFNQLNLIANKFYNIKNKKVQFQYLQSDVKKWADNEKIFQRIDIQKQEERISNLSEFTYVCHQNEISKIKLIEDMFNYYSNTNIDINKLIYSTKMKYKNAEELIELNFNMYFENPEMKNLFLKTFIYTVNIYEIKYQIGNFHNYINSKNQQEILELLNKFK